MIHKIFLFLLLATPALAQEYSTEWYLCESLPALRPEVPIPADEPTPGPQTPTPTAIPLVEDYSLPPRTSVAENILAESGEPGWTTHHWAGPVPNEDLTVSITTTVDGHAAIEADSRCDKLPGSPLDTVLPEQAISRARQIIARWCPGPPDNLRPNEHRKRNLVAFVLDRMAKKHNRKPRWPRGHCAGIPLECVWVHEYDMP